MLACRTFDCAAADTTERGAAGAATATGHQHQPSLDGSSAHDTVRDALRSTPEREGEQAPGRKHRAPL